MIDAALRIAKYGISSALSLVDDVLIEQMRKYHCERSGEPYEEIASDAEDARARRITAYLNLLDRLIHQQVESLRTSSFEPGSEITRYFELLPEGPLAAEYHAMLATKDPDERVRRQDRLRDRVVPGSIDVNIMSKGDRDTYRHGEKLPPQFSDASAALRGFAQSTLASSIIFSAGMNPRLYRYAAEFPDFFPDAQGRMKKHIVLKVSDFHSAAVQGKFLAKHGLWVSEYRVESALNCGGHVFATKGFLLGPILEEFQERQRELVDQLHKTYTKALCAVGRKVGEEPYPVRITVQGGIGTAEEDRLLREHYGVDGTGWATPFLLVPEVTNLDDRHRQKLCAADERDVYLSDSSPFGLPFWNLRTSASEDARRRRIAEGRPGSPCFKGYVKLFNMEFTNAPICTASRQYQKLKLEQLDGQDLPEEQRTAQREAVLAKSCICNDLAGAATLPTGIDPTATPAVCCGPNIVNFSRVATLEEMVGHIYGRNSLFAFLPEQRPHMFLREIDIYIDYLRTQLEKRRVGLSSMTAAYVAEFKENLLAGIAYYRQRIDYLPRSLRTMILDTLAGQQRAVNDLPELA
ncbi:MAG: hypothetical protein ABFC77_14385 [Thermoguttaceae bacterium]